MKLFTYLSLVCLAAALALLPCSGFTAEAAKKVQVLLVTGDDVTPAHNWAEVSQAIRDTLVQSGKFEVRMSEDAGILDSQAALGRYDVVFLHLFNAKTPTLSDEGKENLLNFVKSGKGFVLSHLSSASFKEWDEFKKLCGRYWVMGKSGHGPRSVFKAEVQDSNHPIMQGLADFEADDELYAKMQGDVPIHVLVSAESDWSNQAEPLAFTLGYGQGRVFHELFGHDGEAIRNPSVQKLIVQGTHWAGTGK